MLVKLHGPQGETILIDLEKVVTVVPYTVPLEEQIGQGERTFNPHALPRSVVITAVTQHYVAESVEDIHNMSRFGEMPE
jgi:hypothetical protein